ncbi:MAG: lipopolysaccharide biosynthesis protein [Nocardioides sp.]|nr:lipopolysaccharide biosynthesis protein [Nocardioides sp.]
MWPLAALLLGLPVWWALGLDSFVPLVLAVPMAAQLLRRRPRVLPHGFAWWVLFLVWVALGVLVLWADAPGAADGGGFSRLLVFCFRAAWYAACTVVALWVANTARESLPDELVRRLLAWVFVIATAGGLLGLVAPELEWRSLAEVLLPGRLASNPFVATLVHPSVAEVQDVLGRPEARPKAPFTYTNTWGACLSLGLVALLALDLRTGRWSRALRAGRVVVVLLAAAPVVYSLNRGLWLSLVVGALAVAALAVVRRRRTAVAPARLVTGAAAVATVVVLLGGLLGPLVADRLDHPHSNDRRTQLAVATTESVSTGSPVVGFGGPRSVQGSFSSIAGADSPDCPACAPPPLGTQGLGWMVLFSQGWPGLVFFLGFLLAAFSRSWRCRTRNETMAAFMLGFLALQLAVYDTLGLPLLLVMVAVGLVAREQAGSRPATRAPGVLRTVGPARVAAVVAVPCVLGVAIGAAWAGSGDARWEDTRAVLAPARAQPTTSIDTAAGLLLSTETLARAADVSDTAPGTLRSTTTVAARPGTTVLEVTATAGDPATAALRAEAVADAYLAAGPPRGYVVDPGQPQPVARPWAVATASGLGLGLLAGLAGVALLRRLPVRRLR